MALSIAVGTYVGDGLIRSITGLGFAPKALMIFSDNTAAGADAAGGVWKTVDMPANSPHWGENGTYPGISTLDADGFSLTSADFANKSTKNYYWVAFGGSDVFTGSYVGDGLDNRSITGVGFQPIWVNIQGDASHSLHKMNSTGPSTDISQFGTQLSDASNIIQALETDGFQLGNSVGAGTRSNDSGKQYYYAAFKSSSSVYNASYLGDGTDGRGLTGFGFSPNFVFLKSEIGIQAVARTSDIAGDNTAKVRTNAGFLANAIESLDADGVTLGSDNLVNSNGITYHLISFSTAPVVTESSYGFAGDSYGF